MRVAAVPFCAAMRQIARLNSGEPFVFARLAVGLHDVQNCMTCTSGDTVCYSVGRVIATYR